MIQTNSPSSSYASSSSGPPKVSTSGGVVPLPQVPNIYQSSHQRRTSCPAHQSPVLWPCLFYNHSPASSVAIESAQSSPPSSVRSTHGEALPLPSPRLLRRRGAGGGRDGGGLVGPGGQVRVHGVRADGLHLEGRDGLDDRGDAAGLGRVGDPDRRPGPVGRPHGRRLRLLRARQPRHLQRPGPLHALRPLRHEPHLRRHRRAPRLVLQLPRGHGHRAPPRLRAAALHRRAVARHRRLALPPLRRRRQLRQEEGRRGRRLIRLLPCAAM